MVIPQQRETLQLRTGELRPWQAPIKSDMSLLLLGWQLAFSKVDQWKAPW